MNRLAEIREDETAFAVGPQNNSFRLPGQDLSGSFNFSDSSLQPMTGMEISGRHPMRSVSEMPSRPRRFGERDSFTFEDETRGVQRSFSLPVATDASAPSAHMPEYGLGGSLNLDTTVTSGHPGMSMHSSLPEMSFANQVSASSGLEFGMEGMHQSMPQLRFGGLQPQDSWQSLRSQDDMSVQRLTAHSRERNSHLKPTSKGDGISKDMIDCLEKLNESTIGGHQAETLQHHPALDPIPLTPVDQQQKKLFQLDRTALMQRMQQGGSGGSLLAEPIYTPTVQAPQSLSEHIDRGAFLRSEQRKSPFDQSGGPRPGEPM